MTGLLQFQNGMPLYIVSKLTNDFKERIFCEADQNSIKFIGANNQSTIIIGFYPDIVAHDFFEMRENDRWNYSYLFESKEVKRNVMLFKNKTISNKNQNLVFEFTNENIKIDGENVDAKIETIIQNPSVHSIQKMETGVSARIKNIKDMISHILSISEEVIQMTLTESELKISGKQYQHPAYNIKIYDTNLDENVIKNTTQCHKGVLEVCCRLARDANVLSPELRFHHGGATQLYGKERNVLFHSLLVGVK